MQFSLASRTKFPVIISKSHLTSQNKISDNWKSEIVTFTSAYLKRYIRWECYAEKNNEKMKLIYIFILQALEAKKKPVTITGGLKNVKQRASNFSRSVIFGDLLPFLKVRFGVKLFMSVFWYNKLIFQLYKRLYADKGPIQPD